jgi:hypothetical protein
MTNYFAEVWERHSEETRAPRTFVATLGAGIARCFRAALFQGVSMIFVNKRIVAGGFASSSQRRAAAVLSASFSVMLLHAGSSAASDRGADGTDGGSPPGAAPCPQFVEVLCGAPADPNGGFGPGLTCPCGPGQWMRQEPAVRLDPVLPLEQELRIGKFIISKLSSATAVSASATLAATGRSNCFIGCDTSSVSQTARASFSYLSREVWDGAAPPCPRLVTLSASGDATQSVAVSTTADRGCSASSSSSISGMCSSLGDASAELSNGITAKAQFNSASSKVSMSGNIGASVSIESPSIQGAYSSQDQWEAEGIGSASGAATFTVKPNRDYCAMTNKAIVRRANGSVSLSGGAAVAGGGASSFSTSGQIRMTVD